jgi:hypothetical protein
MFEDLSKSSGDGALLLGGLLFLRSTLELSLIPCEDTGCVCVGQVLGFYNWMLHRLGVGKYVKQWLGESNRDREQQKENQE